MKKIFLFGMLLITSSSLISQTNKIGFSQSKLQSFHKNSIEKNQQKSTRTTTIFSEDFENGMPQSILLIDEDNLTPFSDVDFVSDAWVVDDENISSTNKVAVSTSWYNPAGQADDWMIIPNILIPENSKLSWKSKSQSATYPDGLEVYISTTGTQIANFTTSLYSAIEEPAEWTNHEIDLSGYSGQTVSIAYRNNSDDKMLLYVDDILIFQKDSFDIKIMTCGITPTIEYPITTIIQSQPVSFTGEVFNNGLSNLNNATINANVNNGQYNQSNFVSLLKSDSSKSITIASSFDPTPFAPDTFNIVFRASCSEIDADITNNSDSMFFIVSDTIMSRELENFVSGLGFTGSAGSMGQIFQLNTADTLTSISIYLDQPTAGDEFNAEIWHISGNDTVLVRSSEKALTNQSGWYTLNLEGNFMHLLAGEKYLIAAHQIANTSLTVGYSKDYFVAGKAFYRFEGNFWKTAESNNFEISYGIRPNFGIVRPLPINEAEVTEISGPTSSCTLGISQIKATVRNNGSQDITSFTMKLLVDGVLVANEAITQQIMSLATYEHPFTTSVDLSATGNHIIQAIVSLANDANSANDTIKMEAEKIASSSVPYTMGFESSENLEEWNVVDGNIDGSTWSFTSSQTYAHSGSGYAIYSYSPDNSANDLLASTCISLEAAKTYQISSWSGVANSDYPEKLKIFLCDGILLQDTIQLIADLGEIDNEDWANNINYFSVPTNGTYYIGFYAYSNADMFKILLDDISITETNGTANNGISQAIRVYPNPAQNIINISSNENISTVEFIDFLGQTVGSYTPNSLLASLSLESMAKGMYFIKINGMSTQKLIIK